jgi:hypothetical protein
MEHIIAMAALAGERPSVQRGDQQLRIATWRVTWRPTLYDTAIRASGAVWRVMSINGGLGYPWWLLQVRHIPT